MGSEYDRELGRAWLHGPHVIEEQYKLIASKLFSMVMKELPINVRQLDAYLNIRNARGRSFYSKQGFQESGTLSYDFWLMPGDRVASRDNRCDLLMELEPQDEYQASFLRLFEKIFPKAYYSGERILRMIGDSHQVFVIAEQGEVYGFAVTNVDEGNSIGEIQFLGVREDCRRQSYGRYLLHSSIDWLLDEAGVSLVCLNVNEDRVHARSLYESVGFELKFTGIGLRKVAVD